MKKSFKKESPRSRIVASKRHLTALQITTVALLMIALSVVSVSSMVTYGSDREPTEDIFKNSQTVHVFNM